LIDVDEDFEIFISLA